jgi:5-formyltetrahydrofolate cyclo-ligase
MMTNETQSSQSDINSIKHAMRRTVLARRDALDPTVRAKKSASVCKQLHELLGSLSLNAPTIALFAPMRSEVSPTAFAQRAQHEGCRIAYPCMIKVHDGSQTGSSLLMTFRFVNVDALEQADFVTHPLRSFVPDDSRLAQFPPCTPSEIDLVIAPLVAFDSRGNRLGYGGGNYDRFLPQLRSNTPVFGIAFAEQLVERIPLDKYDQPLKRVIYA